MSVRDGWRQKGGTSPTKCLLWSQLVSDQGLRLGCGMKGKILSVIGHTLLAFQPLPALHPHR